MFLVVTSTCKVFLLNEFSGDDSNYLWTLVWYRTPYIGTVSPLNWNTKEFFVRLYSYKQKIAVRLIENMANKFEFGGS